PTIASCKSSTVLMKCACPITTLKSSGLSTGTTSQESVVVVTRTCCHPHSSPTVGRAPATNDENIVVILRPGDPRLEPPALLLGTGWCWPLRHPTTAFAPSMAGSENEFLALSERMKRVADAANRCSYRDRSGL